MILQANYRVTQQVAEKKGKKSTFQRLDFWLGEVR